MNTTIVTPIQVNTSKPKFEPIQGNILVRGIKRTALCVKIEAIALRAIVYHAATLISIVVRPPLAVNLCSGVGKILFKNHLTLLGRAIKTSLAAPGMAWTSASSREIYLKVELDLFASPNASKTDLLEEALKKGDLRTIDRLIASGFEVDASDALIWTCGYGHAHMIPRLLELGANLEAKTKYGTTPLITAAKEGHVSVVEKLLESGANLEAKDDYGDTPLIAAARYGHASVIEKLLRSGANLEAKDEYGDTPLIAAAEEGHVSAIEKLLESGANLEAKDKYGTTALIAAAREGRTDAILKLVERGANLKSTNKYGHTALDVARSMNEPETANLLIKLGARPRTWWSKIFA